MRTWEERYHQGQADAAESARRTRAEALALQRRLWARGEQAHLAPVTVTGPDDVTVNIRVVWAGAIPAPPAVDRAGRRRLWLMEALGAVATVLYPLAALFLLGLAARWLFIELTGRPHYAVLATAPATGAHVITHRTRRRKHAFIAAATLADRVERDGATALTPAAGR
ncbi:hypothetical protein [Kitasatospora sp. NPDC093806]|uniref:hypothetical protein n=1 Tax=Kitasatospora sp. NPDC093806 TaxID=3155075 RepID=UPI00344A7669